MIRALRQTLHKALRRTPVAWLQVSHNPIKLAIGVAGVSFSNILMFFQLGLLDSIYNSQCEPIRRMRGELMMVSAGYSNLGSLQVFDRSRLYQALGVEGVEGVSPLHIARGTWITPGTREMFDIFVYGVSLSRPSLAFPELEENPSRLQPLRNALFDRNSKEQYGPIAKELTTKPYVNVEVNQKQLRIIDTFSLGATFAADANLIVSDNTYFLIFEDKNPSEIEVGLIQLKPGADRLAVQRTLQPLMPKDVKVVTRNELAVLEMNYWKKNSAVGFIFTLGVVVGFVVGSIIVYQILFTDVMNSLPQYATLKAMGYTDGYVISIVIQQSAILAVVGFIPGFLASAALYAVLANITKLAVLMTVTRALQVLLLTFVMCVGSGSLATRKLVQLDPADVY
ncbi:MAG: FtsX-like permease family protein [Cyanobacteria bacterium K_Offshore_surface_m2_239]|nr:FtsX-like permease family protein [Cyanobacteria bacterium K_Offshore_surface_m2_239]